MLSKEIFKLSISTLHFKDVIAHQLNARNPVNVVKTSSLNSAFYYSYMN